jgi:sarcosine oxidase subunit gamma
MNDPDVCPVDLYRVGPRHRFGLKGPGAAAWLEAHGIVVPPAPNTWAPAAAGAVAGAGLAPLVARLGSAEFFLEDGVDTVFEPGVEPLPEEHPPGVYPVLRRDAAFVLRGARVHDALVQVCNVNFAALATTSRPVVMTSMIGVSVIVVPWEADDARGYRIWCDPTFGAYLGESLGAVVVDGGGTYRGMAE